MDNQISGFNVAAYTLTGEEVGRGFWEMSSLSPIWVEAGVTFLNQFGDNFPATSWGQELNHIETKLTSSDGAGLGQFYTNGQLSISTLYLAGKDRSVDNEVADLFIQSLEQSDLVRQATTHPQPFASIRSIESRPLVVVFVWGNPEISDQDEELLQELSTHFAAAFFKRSSSD
ncbi:hypothetical protein [Algisphaera agarilytica]|uniref:Uncharacterized protein n=1 Tax=Algisphaera agarilytica TaxID=1385975 RepID=A0A7X0LJV1_9BACT|nr:hypothetical protein [Algisphaera agarilytica]MBB6429765.1 hypothetical protein [Algisphaera agarilytica]